MKNKKINLFINKFNKLLFKFNTSYKYSFILLSVLLFALMLFIIIYTSYYNGFLHINSDDILQYYPYINGFFEKLKSGNLSLYDTSLYGGSSIYSATYYVPLDIFTFIAFIFSFFMHGEGAYAVMNYLRVALGALLLFYAFKRKGIKPLVCFLTGLIYFSSGLAQTYYIFPVYLGIIFYAPLAILIVDLIIEKGKLYYLLLPLYSVTVIFYDYYIAYMLLAFTCIYFMIEMHLRGIYTFFGKKFFLKNFDFYKRFFLFMAYILLGVLMSFIILLPSTYYILNESSRNDTFHEASLWFYAKKNDDGDVVISLRHYFTQWCNLFQPNEPHRFCLNDAGDYMREHASLYLTSGGLFYLVYFFFIHDKTNNRLKFWVILFNLLLCIPLVSCILSFNVIPYVRWFFIPLIINIYAMSLSMNKLDLKINKHPYLAILPYAFLICGLVTLTFVFINCPDYYIHYKKTDKYFTPILLTSIIFIGVFLLLYLLAIIFSFFKKYPKVIYRLIPIAIFSECVFSCVITFSNVGNANKSYYEKKEHLNGILTDISLLEEYNPLSGSRINVYTNKSKASQNINILTGNANFGSYFQSFYSPALNRCLIDVYSQPSNINSNWSQKFMGGYTFLSSEIFNVKYTALDYCTDPSKDYDISLPSDYYKCYTSVKKTTNDIGYGNRYYVKESIEPFIVYDSVFTFFTSNATKLEREASILFSGYVYEPLTAKDELKEDQIEELKAYENLEILDNTNIKFTDFNVIKKDYNFSDLISSSYFLYTEETDSNASKEHTLTLSDRIKKVLKNYDVIVCKATEQNYPYTNLNAIDNESIYLVSENNEHYTFHYDTCFHDRDNDYKEIKVMVKDNSKKAKINITGYKFELYDKYKEIQSTYKNKEFIIDGNKISIKCQMPEENKTRIIKTHYSYSPDWTVKDSRYKTVNIDAGFLGVIVPDDIKDVNIELEFIPDGYITGRNISMVSIIIYLTIVFFAFSTKIIIKEFLKNDEENIDNSSLL